MPAPADPHPPGPVVLSVPHAGRTAPAEMAALLRVPPERLLPLEDRHVDLLIDRAVAAGVPAVVADSPRAWIDLNRHENELDPAMLREGAPDGSLVATAKMLGGLGLIPRRLAGVGELWRRALAADEVRARVERVYRPYHARLAASIAAARAAHGRAVLIDLHSMPPGAGADVVVGDRYGRSASPELVARIVDAARGMALSCALNRPYAGGHILERYGDPARNVHAIQIEICRSLYLQPDLATPDPDGVDRMSRLVARAALAASAPLDGFALEIAAE